MDKEKALFRFWGSFGVDAYDENDVPANATYPYITFNVSEDALGNVVSLHADLWDKNTSWVRVTNLKDTIAQAIGGDNSVTLPLEHGGYIYLCGGTPFAQRVDDTQTDIKRIYISAQAEFLCAY